MELGDPLLPTVRDPSAAIIFAGGQRLGGRQHQEDYWINFNDECFAVADGVGGMPHGGMAAQLSAETAIWGYKHIRSRRFYWQDKKLFLKRIFRSANIAVWQKRRETGFEQGLAATLVVAIIGPKNFWVGSVGDSAAYLVRHGVATKLTVDDLDEAGLLTSVVGTNRYGLVPQVVSERFLPGDTLLLSTDGVSKYVPEGSLASLLAASGDTTASLTQAAQLLLDAAQEAGSSDNLTACLIKKVVRGR